MPTYRTDDALRWGTGKGANLAPAEIDLNFWDLDQRVDALEANPAEPVEIASITATGTQMTVHMDDGTTHGPLTLPTAVLRYRGDWTAATVYSEIDLVFVADDGLYLVLRDHTAAATFDPLADDGSGNLLYQWLLPAGAGAGDWDTLTNMPAAAAALPDIVGADGTFLRALGGGLSWTSLSFTYLFDGPGDYGTPGHRLAMTSGGDALEFVAPGSRPVVNKSAAYTFALVDAGKFVDFENASPAAFTIPADATVAFPIGTTIRGGQIGAGALTITAAAGVTLNGITAGSTTLADSQAEYFLRKRAANSWRITGDVAAVA